MSTPITETYIADGRRFPSYEAVEKYASENGYRVANTQTQIPTILSRGRRGTLTRQPTNARIIVVTLNAATK